MNLPDLKEGEMFLQPDPSRRETDPIAYGWKREGEWLVGLVMWRSGKGYRVIEQGRERIRG